MDIQSVLISGLLALVIVFLVWVVRHVMKNRLLADAVRQYHEAYVIVKDAVFAAALENNPEIIERYRQRAREKNLDPFILLAVDRVDAALNVYGIDIPEETVLNLIAAILIQHNEFPHKANTPLIETGDGE